LSLANAVPDRKRFARMLALAGISRRKVKCSAPDRTDGRVKPAKRGRSAVIFAGRASIFHGRSKCAGRKSTGADVGRKLEGDNGQWSHPPTSIERWTEEGVGWCRTARSGSYAPSSISI